MQSTLALKQLIGANLKYSSPKIEWNRNGIHRKQSINLMEGIIYFDNTGNTRWFFNLIRRNSQSGQPDPRDICLLKCRKQHDPNMMAIVLNFCSKPFDTRLDGRMWQEDRTTIVCANATKIPHSKRSPFSSFRHPSTQTSPNNTESSRLLNPSGF